MAHGLKVHPSIIYHRGDLRIPTEPAGQVVEDMSSFFFAHRSAKGAAEGGGGASSMADKPVCGAVLIDRHAERFFSRHAEFL